MCTPPSLSLWQPTEENSINVAGSAIGLDKAGYPVLIGSHCQACGADCFPHAPVCVTCMSEDVEMTELPTRGVIYSHSTVHTGPKHWSKPFVAAYVDLEGSVRVFTRIVGGEPSCGAPVTLDVAPVGRSEAGQTLCSYVFRLNGSAHG